MFCCTRFFGEKKGGTWTQLYIPCRLWTSIYAIFSLRFLIRAWKWRDRGDIKYKTMKDTLTMAYEDLSFESNKDQRNIYPSNNT